MSYYRLSPAKTDDWYFVEAENIHDAMRAVEAHTGGYVESGTQVHRTEPNWDETLVEA